MAQLWIMSDTQWKGLWAERDAAKKKNKPEKHEKLEKNHIVQDLFTAMHPCGAPGLS